MKTPCGPPRRLLSSPGLTVDHCPDCDLFHVHIGPLSLRIDRASFNTLVEGLAVARVEAQVEAGRGPWHGQTARA